MYFAVAVSPPPLPRPRPACWPTLYLDCGQTPMLVYFVEAKRDEFPTLLFLHLSLPTLRIIPYSPQYPILSLFYSITCLRSIFRSINRITFFHRLLVNILKKKKKYSSSSNRSLYNRSIQTLPSTNNEINPYLICSKTDPNRCRF